MLDRLRHVGDVTKFKADQLLRVNRVQSEISNLRREIQTTRDRIASAALELHRSDSLLPAEIEQLCTAVDRLNAQIMEREALIAAIQAELPPQLAVPPVTYGAPAIQPTTRPTRACPHCGFGAPVHAAFCPNCGKALPKSAEPSAPSPADQPADEVQLDSNAPSTSESIPPDTLDTTDTSDTPDMTDMTDMTKGG
jgi:hypothetical protein